MSKLPSKKTKIVCTIGPATDSKEILLQLISNGMNVARLNFAHGDYKEHARVIKTIRAAAEEIGEQVTIMADLPGPKIRIGQLEIEPIELVRGQRFILQIDEVLGNEQYVSVNFPGLPQVLHPGDKIYISDGFIQLEVQKINGSKVYCTVQVGGELRSNTGVNFPGADLGVCAFTALDKQHLTFASEQCLDAISQSFVQDPSDIQAVRDAAKEIGYDPFIIAKIERARAVENLDDILMSSDGIMVARGDLGVEIPIEEIAIVQKEIIRKANIVGKPVITATHMLESMIEHNRPTRAEATDVANAILDGTDCVMLSGETALGKFPIESVAIMNKIACVTEPDSRTRKTADILESAKKMGNIGIDDLISLTIYLGVEALDPVAVVTPTMSGATARRLCRFRLPVWIIAISPSSPTCKGLGFSYGVYPVLETNRPESWAEYTRKFLSAYGVTGELALLTKGTSAAQKVGTNEMEIIDLSCAGDRKIIW